MRGLFNKIFFNLPQRCVFNYNVHKVIISVSLVYIFSVLFIDVMNQFNKVANFEGNRIHYKYRDLYFIMILISCL